MKLRHLRKRVRTVLLTMLSLGAAGCGSGGGGDFTAVPGAPSQSTGQPTVVARTAPTPAPTPQTGGGPAPAPPGTIQPGAKYAPGVLLVKLNGAGTSGPGAQSALSSFQSQALTATGLSLTLDHRVGSTATGVYRITSAASVPEAAQKVSALPGVAIAQPDYVVYANLDPDDSLYPFLWGLKNVGQNIGGVIGLAGADIKANHAWNTTRGAGVTVAVIDTGVDYTHPDLAANMWTNPGEIPGNGVDDDGNSYIDDVYGINAAANNGNPMDDHGHGTHCAGTIAGVGNNTEGVVGVAYESKIMALKFMVPVGGGQAGGFISDAIECIDYAVAKGADLSNNSWGGGPYDQLLVDAIDRAANDDQLFVAAAGNAAQNTDFTPSYPSSYANPNIISVGASTNEELIASFSNYGATSVDLFAPGHMIDSTLPPALGGGAYGYLSGTSMASPHVAGVAALVKSLNPAMPFATIKARILNGADVRSAYQFFCQTGARLNALNAITNQSGAPPISIDPFTNDIAAPGGPLHIWGVGFGAAQGSGTVTIGGTPTNATYWSATHIIANVPANAGPENTMTNVRVQNEAGNFTTQQVRVEGIRTPAAYPVAYNYRGLAGNLTNVTVVSPAIQDETMRTIPIGFTFNYMGVPYQNVTVSDNGFLTFGDARNTFIPASLPSVSLPNRVVAALWYDFDPGALPGRLSYKLINNAPNRELIIDYVTRPYNFPGNYFPGTVSFQWVLKEGDDDITVHYKDVNLAGASATAGFENGSGANGTSVTPANGTAFRFVQQVPFTKPDSLEVANRNATNPPGGNNVTGTSIELTWDDKSSAETGYYVYRRPGAGGNLTVIATLPANSRSFTDSVNATSSYVYQVRAYQNATLSQPSNQILVNSGSGNPSIPGLSGTIQIVGDAVIAAGAPYTQYGAMGNVSGTPTNITNQVQWSSSNVSIATVTSGAQGGRVTGIAGGTVTLTATAAGATAGSFNVTVIGAPPPPPPPLP